MFRARVLAAAALVVLVAVFASAAAASAHDELVSSTPVAGERLQQAPKQVSLTFTETPLTLDGEGMTVLVVDSAGRDWVQSELVVADTTVTAELAAGMPEAGYQLRWQVVSADGHPISGVIPFTVGDAEFMSIESDAAVADADADAGRGQAQDQNTQHSQHVLRTVLLGVTGAAFAVAVRALITSHRRRIRGGSGNQIP